MSSGEPAGIGPDICATLATEALPIRFAVLGDPDVLTRRAERLGLKLRIELVETASEIRMHAAGTLQILPVRADHEVVPGRLEPGNAAYVLRMLETGARLCLSGDVQALVTAPVQKSVINEAGVPFTGHTEFLAELTACRLPVMMLATDRCRVALATTHLPLRDVADSLHRARLQETLQILYDGLERRFQIAKPRIVVLGLNPHAGEGGHLGDEELRIIGPAIEQMNRQGMAIAGPVAADTAFTPEALDRCDAILAMYHDQGLAPLKALSFGDVVNVTLGLPIIRTSVDHGTALSLAGSGRARHDSLRAAVRLAHRLAASVVD